MMSTRSATVHFGQWWRLDQGGARTEEREDDNGHDDEDGEADNADENADAALTG